MIKGKNEIEVQRCNADPVYKLLFYPNTYDKEEECCFIDNLLNMCIEYIKKRYGPKLMENRVNKRVYDIIQTVNDITIQKDYTMKKLVILFIVQYERELSDTIVESYTDGGYFGDKGSQHFRSFMCKIDENVDKTLNFAFHKHNVVTTVNNFVIAASKEYMMDQNK